MSKVKSKDFYRRQHKLAKLKKKQAYEIKRADKLIEDTIIQLDEQQQKSTSVVHTSVVPAPATPEV